MKRKRPLGRPKRRWKYSVRMDLTEVRWEGTDWIHLAQDRDLWQAPLNTVMILLVSTKAENFMTSSGSFSWVLLRGVNKN
jgi:hypothetical protein